MINDIDMIYFVISGFKMRRQNSTLYKQARNPSQWHSFHEPLEA
jgi:hypothetical protein